MSSNWRGGGGGGWRGEGRGFRRPWGWRGRGRGQGTGRGGRGHDDESVEEGGVTNGNGHGNGLMLPPPTAGATKSSGNGNVRGGRWGTFTSGGNSGNGSSRPGSAGSSAGSDPPPKKKRKSIKEAIVTLWKKKLPGYRIYYPDSPPQLSDIDKKINLISDYLSRKGYLHGERLIHTDEKEYFEVICEHVLLDGPFMKGWPDFLDDLINEPSDVVNLWGAVMHKLVSEYYKTLEQENDEDDHDMVAPLCRIKVKDGNGNTLNTVRRIHAGLLKVDPVTPLCKINSSLVGKFVTIRGQIVGAGIIRTICLQMPFMCQICEVEFLVDQPYGVYTLPTRCGVSDDCDNKRLFEPVETSNSIVMMDFRKMKLQDVYETEHGGMAVPKTIECEMYCGLVNQFNTGETVTITGVVKRRKEVHFNGEQSLHNLYIETIALRSHNEAERTAGGNWFTFSDKDYCAVSAIYETPNLFKLLVASFSPMIYGHEFVKAALLLSLFGGTPHRDDVLSRRSDINILMLGDPGIGKSQLLKVVTDIAPRGVYVCGTGSTTCGLTVTLVKDGDNYALESGALVMADRGVCCIDEFDKMAPQHPALLEAMEQQSVSVAKSGVFRTLSARTTVIAAANPVGGHYDKRKSLVENIKISSPMLSRFDVVFILLDQPNKDFDRRVVEHLMGKKPFVRPITANTTQNALHNDVTSEGQSLLSTVPLQQRLQVQPDDDLDLIPHRLMRKYIAYARQYVKPKLSREAAAILKEYYMALRVKHRRRDSTPITTRQLESLVRLTEARAKLELREEATADDARDILEIFESSLSSAFDDEVVAVSALSQSIIIGTPLTSGKSGKNSQAKRLVSGLHKMAEAQGKNTFTVAEIKECMVKLGLKLPSEQLIASLNTEGFLLKKGNRLYQLLTAD